MVKVREDYPTKSDGTIDLDHWLERFLQKTGFDEVPELRRACRLSQQAEREAIAEGRVWAEGVSSFQTGLQMADMLADLRMDSESLIAAVIYRAVREGQVTLEAVEQQFGATVAKLVEGVLRMAAISAIVNPSRQTVLGQRQDQIDNLRKMLVAMVDDVRVALIKLAERTCAIRAAANAPTEKRQRVAREVFDVYAPLAHRLGIGHIKWELEDLSFRYLQPRAYKKIAKLLDERREDREGYIQSVISQLEQALSNAGIEASLNGRAKHIYSIWRKMRRKKIDFYQVYDIRAVRILVPQLQDCYAALGIVHSLWQYVPKEFDDYIATPKENGYRSLHTAVLGPEGKILEVQIRTEQMHEEAEFGVCAHWRYKEGKSDITRHYEDKLAWLRQVLDWHEELGDGAIGNLMDELRQDIIEERVYVFTPEGHVVDLANGATPVDFAYHVHTEVGHRCRGAKVNGRIMPLNHSLKTGDQVEILTKKENQPSRDWLNPNLGYVKTSRARAKIQHWFKQQDRSKNISDGRAMLDREFKRLAITDVDLDKLAPRLNVKTAEDILAALGAGDLRVAQVLNQVQESLAPHRKDDDTIPVKKARRQPNVTVDQGVYIEGVGDLLTQTAGCCKPVPGDAIVGYISVGRGVTVHSRDCGELQKLQSEEPDRIVEVSWSEEANILYPVDVAIEAYDRQGLLRDITSVLANEKINVLAVDTDTTSDESSAHIRLTLEIASLETLGRVLTKINQLPNVLEVRRQIQS